MAETIAQRTARIRRERAAAAEAEKKRKQQMKPAGASVPPGSPPERPAGEKAKFAEIDKKKGIPPKGQEEAGGAPQLPGKPLRSGITATGPTKKSEEQAESWAHQKEMQDQSHKNSLDLQQKSQDFQREQADRADAQWYARQEYLRGQKNRSVKWTFRARSNGSSSRSRWDINIQKFGDSQGSGRDMLRGRIGVPLRDADGKSQIRMNGPSLPPANGGIGQNGQQVNRPDDPDRYTVADRGAKRTSGVKSFAFESRPTTVAEDVANANKGLKPEDRDPFLGTKDSNGITYEQKLNMLAEATASGASVSIAHKAVDAAGKPIEGLNTTLTSEGTQGEIGFFGRNGSGVTISNGGQGFANALKDQELMEGRKEGELGSSSARVAEVDRAQRQQALAKAGVTPSFKLSDFQQRKQGRDGRYYDA